MKFFLFVRHPFPVIRPFRQNLSSGEGRGRGQNFLIRSFLRGVFQARKSLNKAPSGSEATTERLRLEGVAVAMLKLLRTVGSKLRTSSWAGSGYLASGEDEIAQPNFLPHKSVRCYCVPVFALNTRSEPY